MVGLAYLHMYGFVAEVKVDFEFLTSNWIVLLDYLKYSQSYKMYSISRKDVFVAVGKECDSLIYADCSR